MLELLRVHFAAPLIILHIYQVFVQQLLEIIIKLVDFVLLIPKQIHGISIQRIPPYRRIHVLISRADAFVAEAFQVLYLIVDLLLNRII